MIGHVCVYDSIDDVLPHFPPLAGIYLAKDIQLRFTDHAIQCCEMMALQDTGVVVGFRQVMSCGNQEGIVDTCQREGSRTDETHFCHP